MKNNWINNDFVMAMNNAVSLYAHPKLIRRQGGKILFNGFWRDGNKQNVCLWTNNGTWNDIKTGEGGGCKEFAKTAFNMTLPDFMKRFSNNASSCQEINLADVLIAPDNTKSVNLIWSEITSSPTSSSNLAIKWFENERGFKDIARWAGSGFACLDEHHLHFFEKKHHNFLKHRLFVGNQLMVPLRSTFSDEVKNILFRSISPCENNEKTRLLPNAGGWIESNGSPRAFGFPHLIMDFPHLVLCEGAADYFAAECLLEDNEKILPLGVANADALIKWAEWLVEHKYSGRTTMIYHLDRNEQGRLTKHTVGPLKAYQALAILNKNKLRAHLFDWPTYIDNITNHPSEINDLADCLKTEATYRECGPGHLPYLFLALLNFEKDNHDR